MDEYLYPVNLVGIVEQFEQPASTSTRLLSGDVITCQGECIGRWEQHEDWLDASELGSADLIFIPDGTDVPLFRQRIGTLDSRGMRGLAMSRLCAEIRDWYETQFEPLV